MVSTQKLYDAIGTTIYVSSMNLVMYNQAMQYFLKYVWDIDIKDGYRILDVGCGTGLLTFALIQKIQPLKLERITFYGVDFSRGMIKKFEKEAMRKGMDNVIKLTRADIQNLPYQSKFFDLVVLAGILEYPPDVNASLREIYRVLKKGAKFLLLVTRDAKGSKFILEKIFGTKRLFTEEGIKELLKYHKFRNYRRLFFKKYGWLSNKYAILVEVEK